MASHGEKVLAAEWLAVVTVITGDAFEGSTQGKLGGPKLPAPSRFFATMVVYIMLAALSMFGEKAAKLATAFGGVAALAIVLTPPDPTKAPSPTNVPLIVSFFGWLSDIIKSGPNLALDSAGGTSPGSTGNYPGSSTPNMSPQQLAAIAQADQQANVGSGQPIQGPSTQGPPLQSIPGQGIYGPPIPPPGSPPGTP